MHAPDFEQDQRLVQRATKSDPDAMRQIVEQHQDHIYRLVYRMVGETEVAQDVVQDTFLKAFQNLDAVQNGRALSQWLRQIAVNLVRDRWKTRKETRPFEEEQFEAPRSKSSPLSQTMARETETRIQAALMKLPDDYREAFVLKHIEELDYQTISTTLNTSVSAAKVRVHRACKMLRDLLPEYARP